MTDFPGLGATAVFACAIAMIAGGSVKGVVGIGLPLVSLPVMATFIPIPKAIALLLLPSFAGLAIGQWLRGYINEDLFRKTLAGVLFLIGLNLIRKALG